MSLRILLVCGTGASSGFMAVSMRKAAAKHGLNYHIQARSEAELENYLEEIDVVMVGPHLSFLEDEIKQMVAGKAIRVMVMDPDYYSTLDGEKALEHLQSVICQNRGTADE